MTVSADSNAALATIKSLHTIRHELGCHTSLGVSNISFGLPNRDIITSVFFTICMENEIPIIVFGLSEPENIIKAAKGEKTGTYVGN